MKNHQLDEVRKAFGCLAMSSSLGQDLGLRLGHDEVNFFTEFFSAIIYDMRSLRCRYLLAAKRLKLFWIIYIFSRENKPGTNFFFRVHWLSEV